MADTIGELLVKVGLDNTGFNQGMKELDQSLKLARAEFQAAAAKMGDMGSAADQLKLKVEYLNKQAEVQRQKVAALKDAYEKAASSTEQDAVAVEKLQIKMLQAEKVLANMEQSLSRTVKELELQASAWTQPSKKAEEASQKLKAAGSSITSAGQGLSLAVTAPLVAAGTAAVKLASDTNEALNKVEVAFQDNAQGVKDWSDTTLQRFGIARGTALDMASTYGDMATGMGLNTEQAEAMSKTLVGLAGDLSSFKNISIDIADTALKSVFTGETESLKQLGIVMTQANLQEYAYSQGIKKRIQDMSQSEQTQLRYNYVLAMTKNAQGDFERTGAGTANQMRVFSESLKELGSTMGQHILPVITPLIQHLNELVQRFGALSPSVQQTILVVAGVADAIGPVALIIGQLVTAAGAISGVVGTAAAAIAGAGGATAVLGTAFTTLTGPIGIAAAVIAGLILVVKELWQNNEGFRNAVKEIWSDIGAIISKAGTAIKTFWDNWGQDITAVLTNIWNIIKAVFQTAAEVIVNAFGFFLDVLQGDWQGAWEHMKNIFTSLWNGIKTVVVNAFEGLRTLHDTLLEIGTHIIQGLIDGIKSRIEKVREIAGEVAETVKGKIKEALSIRSPSQVMHEYGLNISEGLGTGMQEGLTFVEGSVSDIIATLVDMRNNLEKIAAETNEKLLEAEKEYADQCREVKSKLAQDEIALQQELSDKLAEISAAGLQKETQAIDAFKQNYKAKLESIKNQIGLFDEVKPQKVSGKSLLGNLEDQVSQFDSWQGNLKSLAAKGVDEGLIDELRQMGVKAAPQVAALNTLTTDELNKYVTLWKTKNAQARAEANIEMRQARVDLNQRLSEIRMETQNQLAQQTIEMQNKLMEMKAKADEELANYKKAWEEKNGEIKKNAAETIDTIEKKYEEIVKKSAGYGIQAMSELIRGIRSRMSSLQSVMDEVRSIMGSGMDPNQRNSPSLVDKIKVGVADITAAYSTLKSNFNNLGLQSAIAGIAPVALGTVSSHTTSNTSTTVNRINITVNGGTADVGEQIYRTLLAKGVRFSG
ncbi:MAG: hypothetical protein BWY65_01708 [Firmicutes bacterium ADurb.Bin373]|nr:MAG: hypothetical protein BWY65_01708 [Firmicutes bacterium ADurb.Bin373]